MSVDFNSMISQAASESQRRKNIGNSFGFVEVDGVTAAAQSQKAGSELSVEDIANAMKSGRVKKESDNRFIEQNGRGFKVNREGNEESLSPASLQAQEKITNMQNKITAIQNNAEVSLGRQNNIAESLKSYQQNPFIN